MSTRSVVLASLALAIVLGFFFTGPLLYASFIGQTQLFRELAESDQIGGQHGESPGDVVGNATCHAVEHE